MKRILKKNQIIITALAIMIAVAGYINYKDLVSKHAKDTRQTNVSLALGTIFRSLIPEQPFSQEI